MPPNSWWHFGTPSENQPRLTRFPQETTEQGTNRGKCLRHFRSPILGSEHQRKNRHPQTGGVRSEKRFARRASSGRRYRAVGWGVYVPPLWWASIYHAMTLYSRTARMRTAPLCGAFVPRRGTNEKTGTLRRVRKEIRMVRPRGE